jgi:hypothetical protein
MMNVDGVRQVCARALLNLLTDNTIFKALQEVR